MIIAIKILSKIHEPNGKNIFVLPIVNWKSSGFFFKIAKKDVNSMSRPIMITINPKTIINLPNDI